MAKTKFDKIKDIKLLKDRIMTLLAATLDEKNISLVMDTLITNSETMQPWGFGRKFLTISNRFALGARGDSRCIYFFYNYVNENLNKEIMKHIKIDNFAKDISGALREMPAEIHGGLAMTFSLFGLDEEKDQARCYDFSSKNSFIPSMTSEPSVILRPSYSINMQSNSKNHRDYLLDIAIKTYHVDRSCPIKDRAHIGGELEYVTIDKDGVKVETLCQFDSYEKEKEYILQNNR